jgi:glycosyltransferase involved in cell wall biosynthesis
MPAPRVSVLLPVYNASTYLPAAVRSILEQTFGDFELIAIDDGSTDDSLSILRDFTATDARVRLISRPNTGYTVALNEAIGLARAPLLARMDADDISLPERFAKQVAYLDSHQNVAAVGAAAQFFTDAAQAGTYVLRHPVEPAKIRVELRTNSALVHPAVIMRRSAVEAVGGYRPVFEPAEDYDLWLRLSERFDLGNLFEVLLRYRIHDDQVSARQLSKQVMGRLGAQACAKLRRKIGRDPAQDWPARTLRVPDLLAWHMSPKRIERELLEAFERPIEDRLGEGRWDDAAAVLADLDELLATVSSSWTGRARRARLSARLNLARSSPATDTTTSTRAWALRPDLLLTSVRAAARKPKDVV